MFEFISRFGYLLVFVFLIIAAFFQTKPFKILQKCIIWILMAIYCVFYAFRNSSVGFDYENYLVVYKYAQYLPLDLFLTKAGYMEPGYLLINKFFAVIGASVPVFQFFLVAFFVVVIYKYLISGSKNPLFTTFALYSLGIFFNYMNQVRSALAATICLIAIDQAKKKKWALSLVLVAGACTIHTSAVVGLILIAISYCRIQMTGKSIIKISVCVGMAWILFDRVLNIALEIFPRYKGYFASDKIDTFIKQGSVSYLVVFMAIMLFAFYFRKKIDLNELAEYDLLLWGVVLGVAFSLLAIKTSMIQRFFTLPLLFSAALLSRTLYSIASSRMRLVYYLTIGSALMGYCYIYLYISENHMGRDGVVPYLFMG